MSTKRAYFIMLGIIGLLAILLLGSAYMGEKLLHKQADKLLALKLDNQLLDKQQTALVKANRDLQQYSELGHLAETIVPQDKDQAKTVREILNIAAETGIPLTAINFSASTLGNAVPKAVTTNDSTSTATTPVAPPVTQLKPVDGIKGLYRMEIIIMSNPTNPQPYSSLQNFLSRLEQNRRTAQVSQIIITPYSKDISKLSFQLTINVFVKP